MSDDGEETHPLASCTYLLNDKGAFSFEEWRDINDRYGLLCHLMMLAPKSGVVRTKTRYARAERECCPPSAMMMVPDTQDARSLAR